MWCRSSSLLPRQLVMGQCHVFTIDAMSIYSPNIAIWISIRYFVSQTMKQQSTQQFDSESFQVTAAIRYNKYVVPTVGNCLSFGTDVARSVRTTPLRRLLIVTEILHTSFCHVMIFQGYRYIEASLMSVQIYSNAYYLRQRLLLRTGSL